MRRARQTKKLIQPKQEEPAPPRASLLQRLATRETAAGLALALLTLVVFAPVCSCDFIDLDDRIYVSQNPHVLHGLNGPDIVWSFTTLHAGNWHPLTWLSLQLDAQLFGDEASAFHRTNLILHVLNVLLLYGLLARMTGSWICALSTAALFALHPLRVESVAWIAERKDVLSVFFGLLAVSAYLRFASRRSATAYAMLLLLYAASLMAKPTLVTLPFVLLLLDYWPLRRLQWGQLAAGANPQPPFPPAPGRQLLVEKLPLFVLVLGSCVVTFHAQDSGGAVESSDILPLWPRLANALDSTAAYLRQTLWPTGLAAFYPYPRSGIPIWRWLMAGVMLPGFTALAVFHARSRPYLLVGWLWFLGTLVPVIGLVQVGLQARADRYTYVPHMGLFLAAVWTLAGLGAGRRPLILCLAAALLLPCMILTRQQIGYWANGLTLWKHVVAVTDNNVMALSNYGGCLVEAKQYDEGFKQLQKVLELAPNWADALGSMGYGYEMHDENEAALDYYRRAAAAKPNDTRYHEYIKRVEAKLAAKSRPP